MKTHATLLIAITTFTLSTIFGAPKIVPPPSEKKGPEQFLEKDKPAPELFNHSIAFYNPGDTPPILPFLSVHFAGVTAEEIKTITVWKSEMDKKFKEKGSVLSNIDYAQKAGPILEEYAPKFMKTGLKSLFISFDRIRKGLSFEKK